MARSLRGSVLTAIGECLRARGHSADVVDHFIDTQDEDELWTQIGPIVDQLERRLQCTGQTTRTS